MFHHISLVAFLAWVGLGADGLSSSAYGPDESFRALGDHQYMAVALGAATALTVLVISLAYSQIIRRFPFGGGGYIVASRLLGPRWGVVSGSALLIDYVLTISTSIASAADQLFSLVPPAWHPAKLAVEGAVIGVIVVMNLRGVRESVTVLAPIFLFFLATHAIFVFGGIGSHLGRLPEVAGEVHRGFAGGLTTVGVGGLLAIFLRAYSMGAGTYTGIEAVSNGLQIMREPKVQTAQRTMTYMAISLAVTAGGILLIYMLFRVRPIEGQTMNAAALRAFAGGWRPGGFPAGIGYVMATLAAEAALLVVAAQAGFIDGPRVMANMAIDSWLPHRFAQLSDRLTMQNGVLLMGVLSIATLLYTGGDITALVTMYSINVFITFSLSQAAMLRYWLQRRSEDGARRGLAIHGVAFTLCLGILGINLYEKLGHGGWITLLVTALLVFLCLAIRKHYRTVQTSLHQLNEIIGALPSTAPAEPRPVNPGKPTAVLLVGGYSGLGIHQLLTVQRLFPDYYRDVIFVSVGVIDSATMQGQEEVDAVEGDTRHALEKYVGLAHRLGLAADYRLAVGTEAVVVARRLCLDVAREFPHSMFFAGKLIFEREHWYQRFLHNETAYQLQRQLQFDGLNAMVLPVRVLAPRG